MTTTLKAGVAIDDWKLPIFTRHLTQAGYTFKNTGELIEGTLLLQVETTNPIALQEVLRSANTECARTGAPQ